MEQIPAALARLGPEQLTLLFRINLRRALHVTMAPGDWGSWSTLGSSAQLADSVAGLGNVAEQMPDPAALAGFVAATSRVFAAHDEAPLDSGFWPFSACRIAQMCAVALEAVARRTDGCSENGNGENDNGSLAYAGDQVEEFFEFADQVDDEAAESTADNGETETTTHAERELAFWLTAVRELADGEASPASLARMGDRLAEQYVATLQA